MNEKGKQAAAAAILAAPVAMALGSGSQASADPAPAKPLAVQLGVGELTGNGGDVTDRTGLHAGASWTFATNQAGPGSRTGIDIDENYNSGKGGHINVVGLTLTERAPLESDKFTAGKPYWYAGVGIGLYNTQASKRVTVAGSTTPGTSGQPAAFARPHAAGDVTTTESKNTTNVGGKIMLGYEMGTAFVEASYEIVGSVEGVRGDSVNLAVGLHF